MLIIKLQRDSLSNHAAKLLLQSAKLWQRIKINLFFLALR